jgi:DNA-binding NtrC family response regulator
MADRAPGTKILLAVTPDTVEERLRHVLTGHDLISVRTGDEALGLLHRDKFGMVIVSVHFDESQMFALVQDIRAHAKYRKVPILCVLGMRHQLLSDIAIQGLDHAVKAMTANGFLDLQHFYDDDEGNERIRRIVDHLILIDGDLQHIARAKSGAVPAIPERRRASGG